MGRHFASVTAYSDKRIRSALVEKYRNNLSIARLTTGLYGADLMSLIGRNHVNTMVSGAMVNVPAAYEHAGPWYLLILASNGLGPNLTLFQYMSIHCFLTSTWRLDAHELWMTSAAFTRPKSHLTRALRGHGMLCRLVAKPMHELLALA